MAYIRLTCSWCNSQFEGWHSSKFCSADCALDRGILVRGPDECWPWQGAKYEDGYGKIAFRDKTHQVHRFAYETKIGPIPEGMVIRHSCDNPICANYAKHLLIGTPKDNARDAADRNLVTHGSAIHCSKFSPEKVSLIRLLCKDGAPYKQLARAFRCSDTAIRKLVSGATWNRVHEGLPTI